MSKLFMYEELEFSVCYHSSCSQSEVRSFLFAASHLVILKTNEVWQFWFIIISRFLYRSDYLPIASFFLVKDCRLDPTIFGIWLIFYLCSTMLYPGKWIWDWLAFLCIHGENVENFGLGRMGESSCLIIHVWGTRIFLFIRGMALCPMEDWWCSTLSCDGKRIGLH